MLILTDESPFPSGKKFKGTPMSEVPDSYLLWWFEVLNERRREVKGRENQAIQNYVRENLDAIRENIKNNR